jgi:hypothetical protein
VDVKSHWKDTETATLAAGGVSLDLRSAWHAPAIAGLTEDGTPALEFHVTNAGSWQPEVSEPFLLERQGDTHVIGVPANLRGWPLWQALSSLSGVLASIPDAARIELITADPGADEDSEQFGRIRWSGIVSNRKWTLSDVAPASSSPAVGDAIGFVRDLFENGRIVVAGESDRAALDKGCEEWLPILGEAAISRTADGITFNERDVRTLVLLAQPVFKARFGGAWPVPVEEDWG